MIINDRIHSQQTFSLQQQEPVLAVESPFRTVFGSEVLKREFVNFLNTIFYQLDDHKVLEQMDRILADPTKSDEEIYKELVASIDGMRKSTPSLFHRLKALFVLQKGMGLQTSHLLQGFRKEEFHNYLEVYFRRYLKTIQKTAGLPLDGKVYDVSDAPATKSFKERLEAGAIVSSYPYSDHVPLNDPDCVNPDLQPEKTHKPIGDEVQDNEIDLIACLGGLHHIPKERTEAFVDSMHSKLRPGGVLLLRDHDVTTKDLWAIAAVVHSFVNAENNVAWDVESKEVREFHSADYWTHLLENHHFSRLSSDNLILKDDPTQNGMIAFVKQPMNVQELQTAARYRKDCVRPADGTRATWIEWGNVRYSKQYAEFIQTKHSYAFDYIGHLKQHWTYFTQYLKESRKEMPLKEILATDNFGMNLFMLGSTAFQCGTGLVQSLPSMAVAKVQHGSKWREATDLTALERYEAKVEKEYSEFIDHTPFYMFPYLSKVKGLWDAALHSNESVFTKAKSAIGATFSTMGLAMKAAISAPIASMYTNAQGGFVEPDLVSILIHDPENQFQTGKKQIGGNIHNIKVVYQTPDGHKVVMVPRYRPFTDLCKELAQNDKVKLIEIGSRSKVTVDVMYGEDEKTLLPESGARLIYELDKLQDEKKRRYATYEVDVPSLAAFETAVGSDRIEYVHE